VPPEFVEARSRGAEIADRIVALSKESIDNLNAISAEEEAGNYSAGLNLILEEVQRNERARKEALGLSQEISRMAAGLAQVQPAAAAKIGLEAIVNELQIVQRLINYNSYIFQLLDVLQSRLSAGGSASYTKDKIKELIGKMNKEAAAINELNSKYQSLMKEFDQLTSSI
jgi:hypothetical protein